MEKQIIGFVGVGVMGRGMINNLLQAGYEVHIYTRTKTKASALIEKGAIWEDSIRNVAKQCETIITIVGYPTDVEQVYFGADGIIKHANKGTYIIDMTTSKPSLAQQINKSAKENGLCALDAPVSGGDVGARDGKLSIMVGGSKDDFEQVLPILQVMGQNIVYQGESGSGQHTKMANQIAIASKMLGVAEAIVYAKKAGLNPETVLQSIGSGAAGSWSLTNLAPRMIKGDFEPGFYIKHFVKDMRIAIEEAENMELELPGLKLAKNLYDQLIELGYSDKGTQAILKYYEKE